MSELPTPNPDRGAAETLRRVFDSVGYSEHAIEELLGEDVYSTGAAEAVVHDRRLPQTQIGAVIRSCFLGLPISTADVPSRFVDAYVATGLAEVRDGRLVPHARIAPVQEVYLASDGYSRGEDPSGYVATYTPTARTLDLLTPRRHVRRALDVGTGPGTHALLAARHSDHVVATDVNPRALAFTQLNVLLNGVENVEARAGSLFEPVAGETFDLIACNAPFVVSPESRFTYRDTGLPADELSRRIVGAIPEHLADDGFAAVLVSWVAEDPDDPDERIFRWLDGNGCDAWVLGISGADPLSHAAGWNDYLHHDPERFAAALDEWVAYFRSLDIQWISEGAVLLHRRAGETAIRFDAIDDEELEDGAGAQIERFFATQAHIAERGVLGERIRLAPDARIERDFEGDEVVEARLRLDSGLGFERELDEDEEEVVSSLNGSPFQDARRVELVEDLLDQGFVEFA
jgi:methylase of polypeptide subunit release factors